MADRKSSPFIYGWDLGRNGERTVVARGRMIDGALHILDMQEVKRRYTVDLDQMSRLIRGLIHPAKPRTGDMRQMLDDLAGVAL